MENDVDDDHIPSSVRQANKLLRRHLLRAQTSRAKAAECTSVRESPEAEESRAREVLEAYEYSKYGAELPPLSAFGHVPDGGVDLASTGPGAEVVGGGVGPSETALSALFVGLHRRVLCRVTHRRSDDGMSDYEKPGEEALAYFRRILRMGYFPPRFMCSLLVQLLVKEAMPDEAEEVFQDIVDRGVSPTEACATEMIRLRVQRGQVERAMEILVMLERQESCEEVPRLRFRSYQPVIRGLFQRGDIEGVLKLWKHMQWRKILPKESFVLDLMADLSSCPEGARGEQTNSVADQILDGVSQTLMYPSAPTVSALLKGWGAVWTDVSEQGTCTACGAKLQKMGLSPLDRKQMRSSIMRVAALRSAREVQRLSWFATWLSSQEEMPTAVIDGPNVAYMGQNHPGGSFRLEQVDWLAEHLREMGERVLIVMPSFYCMPEATHNRRDRGPMRKVVLSEEDFGLLRKWTERNWLIMTEGLDDLYWMYSTVAHDDIDTVVITNDAMRDHRNFMPSARHFARWKRGHMVRYAFQWGNGGAMAWDSHRARSRVGHGEGDSRNCCGGGGGGGDGGEDDFGGGPSHPPIKLISGAAWDEVQRSGQNWHLPVRLRTDPGSAKAHMNAKSWLCVPVPKASLSESSVTLADTKGVEAPMEGVQSAQLVKGEAEQYTDCSEDDIGSAATA